MWEQDECIVIKYMIGQVETFESNKRRMEKYDAKPKQELPAEFVSLPVEDLAAKVVEAHKKEHPIRVLGRRGAECFYPMRPEVRHGKAYEYLGISRIAIFSEAPGVDIRSKMEKVEEIANKQLCKAYDEAYKEEFEKEIKDFTTLTAEVYAWAAAQRLEELKPGDLDVFLFEKNLTLLREVQTKLINQVNLKLKTQ